MKLSEYIKEFGDKQVDVDKLSEFIIEDKVFVPKVGDTYWYIDSFGNVRNHVYSDLIDHDQLITSTQVYRTKTEAESARDKAIFLEFMRKEFLRNSDEIDWGDNNQTKYYLYYDHYKDCIESGYTGGHQTVDIQTTSEEWLKQFIDKHEDDIKKYYFEVKE